MQTVYFGTYTKKDSKGIYKANFDAENGTLTDLELVVETKNPTYLDTHLATNRLFSVADEQGKGGINVWDLNNPTPSLVSALLQPGNAPCYVHYDTRSETLFDANYHMGTVHAYQESTLEKTFQFNPGSHAHFAHTHPTTGDLFVCDLGLDVIHKYQLLNEIATYHTPTGSGPRHIAFHPTAPILYVFTELSSEIIVLRDDEFELSPIQTLSTLPKDEQDVKSGAAIRISDDGKFVYASNRGHDSISVFKVLDDFTLEFIQNIASEGGHPRDFILSPDQNYVLVANRDSNNVVTFKRDTHDGTLSLLSKDFTVPEVVCVHFPH